MESINSNFQGFVKFLPSVRMTPGDVMHENLQKRKKMKNISRRKDFQAVETHGFLCSPPVELVEPVVKGTLNVLEACSEANVKKVSEANVKKEVYVSLGVAIGLNPNWSKGKVMDETCWSDEEYCRTTNNWYCRSKIEAEFEAWEFAKRSGLNLISVCPALVLGPMLQYTTTASSLVLVKL